MIFAREPIKCKLAVNNRSIDQIMCFNYLGVQITSNRNLSEEVITQTRKATAISGYLRDVIWKK